MLSTNLAAAESAHARAEKYLRTVATLFPTANGRKKSHFVTRRKRCAPTRIFLIHRSGNRRTKFGKFRKAPPVALEKIFYASAIGKIGVILSDVPQYPSVVQKTGREHAWQSF